MATLAPEPGFNTFSPLLSSSNLFLKDKDEGTDICPVAEWPMLRSCVSHSLRFIRLNVAETYGIAAPAFSVKFIAFKKMVELMTYKNLSVRVVFKKHNLIRL